MGVDFRNFRGVGNIVLLHSAKGSTWENHKYIKRINGTYYYPDSYEGGRHLPDGEKDKNYSSKDEILDKLEDITGMKREGLSNLFDLSREKGYDSKEFKDLLRILSEGDDDQANRMIDLIKQGEASKSSSTLSSDDVEKLAMEVIRGNFGDGQIRKDLMGEYYEQVQNRVNEIYREKYGSTKITEVSEKQIEAGEKVINEVLNKTPTSSTAKGLDYETIFSVYRKK